MSNTSSFANSTSSYDPRVFAPLNVELPKGGNVIFSAEKYVVLSMIPGLTKNHMPQKMLNAWEWLRESRELAHYVYHHPQSLGIFVPDVYDPMFLGDLYNYLMPKDNFHFQNLELSKRIQTILLFLSLNNISQDKINKNEIGSLLAQSFAEIRSFLHLNPQNPFTFIIAEEARNKALQWKEFLNLPENAHLLKAVSSIFDINSVESMFRLDFWGGISPPHARYLPGYSLDEGVPDLFNKNTSLQTFSLSSLGSSPVGPQGMVYVYPWIVLALYCPILVLSKEFYTRISEYEEFPVIDEFTKQKITSIWGGSSVPFETIMHRILAHAIMESESIHLFDLPYPLYIPRIVNPYYVMPQQMFEFRRDFLYKLSFHAMHEPSRLVSYLIDGVVLDKNRGSPLNSPFVNHFSRHRLVPESDTENSVKKFVFTDTFPEKGIKGRIFSWRKGETVRDELTGMDFPCPDTGSYPWAVRFFKFAESISKISNGRPIEAEIRLTNTHGFPHMWPVIASIPTNNISGIQAKITIDWDVLRCPSHRIDYRGQKNCQESDLANCNKCIARNGAASTLSSVLNSTGVLFSDFQKAVENAKNFHSSISLMT
ncbi:MAG: hypothetical protein QW478_03330, partial [Candidatus Micrarchaeaceae archaeon]